jgi:hypothetical protein
MYTDEYARDEDVRGEAATIAMNFFQIQPTPIETRVARNRGVTGIVRFWSGNDAAKCRLCPACSASDGVCFIMTTEPVDDDEADLFRETPREHAAKSPRAAIYSQ